jgi:virginiamycin A acetyltransferase
VLYHYGPEKLVIGKFCALDEGVRFIMSGSVDDLEAAAPGR